MVCHSVGWDFNQQWRLSTHLKFCLAGVLPCPLSFFAALHDEQKSTGQEYQRNVVMLLPCPFSMFLSIAFSFSMFFFFPCFTVVCIVCLYLSYMPCFHPLVARHWSLAICRSRKRGGKLKTVDETDGLGKRKCGKIRMEFWSLVINSSCFCARINLTATT